MAAPYTAEDLDALRELSEYEDMMGLGARRLLATIDAVTAERDALREAIRSAPTVRCAACKGRGVREECEECHDTDWGHQCPPPARCEECDGAGALAQIRALRALLGGDR